MRLKKGDKFKNYLGNTCFISHLGRGILRLTYLLGENSYTEPWDRKEFIEEVNGNRFFPLPKPKITRENISEHLIEYQLNMVGRTIEDAKKDEMWYYNWTFTTKQYELFREYAIPLLKKTFKFNTRKAEQTFDWFNLQFGLRLKD